ncbi:hypothetical protein [Sinomonas sp. RB5]|jgi:hypothetical protein
MDIYELAVAIAAGARFADRLASAYPDPGQGTCGDDLSPTDELFAAERGSALDELRSVLDSSWWAEAEPHAIGRVFARARSLRAHSQQAARAEEMIRAELLTRYGIDVDRAAGPPQLVQNQFERFQLERFRAALTKSSTRSHPATGRSE